MTPLPYSLLPLLVALLLTTTLTHAVDQTKFRTCTQTGFCRRHRNKAPANAYTAALLSSNPNEPYKFLLHPGKGYTQTHPNLSLTVDPLSNGAVRVRVQENNPATARWESSDILLPDGLVRCSSATHSETPQTVTISSSCSSPDGEDPADVVVSLSPFKITVKQGSEVLMSINEAQLFHFEHKRSKLGVPEPTAPTQSDPAADHHNGKKIVGYWEDGLARYEDGTTEVKPVDDVATMVKEDEDGFWEEKFQSHHDAKPNGPMSIGVDITFPQKSTKLYGIPEHASSLALHATRTPPSPHSPSKAPKYKDPYRLYNLDVFEYDLDVPMSLYGSIPLLISHSVDTGRVAGAFFNNPSEMFIDIWEGEGMGSHWMAETGVMEIFLLVGGSKVSEVYKQYSSLTGTQALPPLFSLGYHQCRWNYKDEKDVYAVHKKFEEHDYPYDVLWLDIEHTDGKRYFTWDKRFFPNPVEMQQTLWEQGRRMVTIVDPHIKRDNNYYVHKEATAKSLYIKNADGHSDFNGWCWPGDSSYLDFTEEKVRKWWAEQFKLDKYVGSTPHLHIWNDMNEMSVFNGPEVTMQKTTKNLDGVEHREWHNIYGMLFQRATSEGLVLRSGGKERSFVLSRSFYAGSQRWGAIWTGDNAARWDHLAAAGPMLLTINTAGLSFIGADVGGFFGNADSQLMVRWMQSGAYQPFFRGHAHHDSARREPWLFGDEALQMLRQAAMERYALLPFWYTVFHTSSITGMPVMRPLWMEYPKDANCPALDHQWLIGSDLLVCPVVQKDAVKVNCYFPGNQDWYDVRTMQVQQTPTSKWANLDAPLDTIPVFQRSGSIIPKKMRLRRSTEMMKNDPYTLVVAGDSATGELYIDDGHSFDFENGEFAKRRFDFADGKLTNTKLGGNWGANGTCKDWIERIIFMGVSKRPSKVVTSGGQELEFTYDKNTLVVRKPELGVVDDWTLQIIS